MQNTFTCNFKLKLNLINIKHTLQSEDSINILIYCIYWITYKIHLFAFNFKLKLNAINIKHTLQSEDSVNINILYYYITINLN